MADDLETKWCAEVQPLAHLSTIERQEQPINLLLPSARLAYFLSKFEIKTIGELRQLSLIDFAQQPGMLEETLREIQAKLTTLDFALKENIQIRTEEHPAACMQPIGNDYQLCIEFSVPVKPSQIPSHYKKSLTPWLEAFLGFNAQDIKKALREEWATIQSTDGCKLRDYFLSLTPTGIASDVEGAWLVFRDETNEETPTLFLQSPKMLTEEEQEFIAGFNIDSLAECASIFNQCHERDLWENALCFCNFPHSDKEFDDSVPDDKLSEWEGGMHIYTICSGDRLLLGKDGRIAQALHELVWSGRIIEGTVPVLNTFSDFIDYYIRYLKNPHDDSISPLFWGDYPGNLKLI